MADGEPLFDEAFIANLHNLALNSRRSMADGLAGEHRSRRRGSSPEFADFKMYSQGDDFRRIDWNLYARLDEIFVRLSEVTTELSVHLLLDASASMAWRGGPDRPSKLRYGQQLAGSIGYLSLWHFDRVTLTSFGEHFGEPFGPAQGRAHIQPLLSSLARIVPLGQTDVAGVLDRYRAAKRRPGMLVLISDLLSGEPVQLAEPLRMLRAAGWQTIILHVLDDDELRPKALAEGGIEELIAVEDGERLRVALAEPVIARYEAAVDRWLAEIDEVCAEAKADLVRLRTSQPVQDEVLGLLNRRGIVA